MTPPETAATCPQCGSTSVQAVPIPRKQIAQAVIVEYFAGTAAGVAAGSSTVIQAICLKCGAQWFPGTSQERRMRALSGQFGDAAAERERRMIAEEEKARRRSSGLLWLVLGALFVLTFAAIGIWQSRTQGNEAATRLAIWKRDSAYSAQHHQLKAFLRQYPRPPGQ